MHDVSQKSQSLVRIAKLAALLCGAALVVVSIYPEDSPFKNTDLADFVQDQWALLLQLKWLIGALLIAFGLLYPSRKLPLVPEYSGVRDLSQDGYKLYLLNKYRIEKNAVLDQISCHEHLFPSAAEALLFAHGLECSGKRVEPLIPLNVSTVSATVNGNPDPGPMNSPETSVSEAAPIKAADAELALQPVEKRNRLSMVFIPLLFALVIGGIYYAKTQSNKEEATPAASPITPINADQVAPNIAPVAAPIPPAEVPVEAAVKPAGVPINERWIGTWAAQDNKPKLVITASNFKYGNDDFSWVGIRPKGVIQCCPAFYEGSSSKADLLQRVQQQAPTAGTQSDQQKTLEAIKALSEGNFKRIVLADPLLRQYFFIYDQNFIYRINRDLGDNANVVVEQFKRSE
jgi:hypothetical protein